jgi:phosphocarrier protein
MDDCAMSDEIVAEGRARVRNRLGLHARPAAEFVKLAARFQSEIQLSKDGLAVNGKSIMGVLMLAAERGSELVIQGVGPDAAEAVEVLRSCVEEGFKES